jgi:hypothetical protein
MKKEKAEDRRVVIDAESFGPEQLLALSKICDPKSAAVVKAREAIVQSKVYDVDITVRVVGDIEVGVAEQVPEKFDNAKYLVAALAALPAKKRKQVLRRPVVKRSVAGAMKAEIDAVKEKLPKHPGPAKLTPHLTVTKIAVGGGIVVGIPRTDGVAGH